MFHSLSQGFRYNEREREREGEREREANREKLIWDDITINGQVNPESNTLQKFILFIF